MLTAPRSRLGPRPYEHWLPLFLAAVGLRPPASIPPAEPLLAEAALYHGVAGPVLAAGRRGDLTLRPETLLALEAVHTRRVVRTALLRAELPRVTDAVVAACGRPPIVVKGPAVADRFHADPEYRPFEDLDLLLPAPAVEPAALALEAGQGYQRRPQPWPRSRAPHNHATELVRRHGVHELLIELHWRVGDDPLASGLDHTRLALHAEPLHPGSAALAPDLADEMLVLAVHLLHHGDKKLIWLLDLRAAAQIATTEEWRAAFDRADAAGLGWVLHTALEIGERHLGPFRERPGPAPAAAAWGPLRAATVLGDNPIGYHAGHLATLRRGGRVGYLLTGLLGVAGRQARRLGRRALHPALPRGHRNAVRRAGSRPGSRGE